MDASAVVVKTQKGQDEIKRRAHKLPQRVRAVLIMIDGERTVGEISNQAAHLGLGPEVFDEFEVQGFIARRRKLGRSTGPISGGGGGVRESTFWRARQFMNNTVVDAQGNRPVEFTRKLERCTMLVQLRGLFDEYARAIQKKHGEAEAQAFIEHARKLLA